MVSEDMQALGFRCIGQWRTRFIDYYGRSIFKLLAAELVTDDALNKQVLGAYKLGIELC